MTRFQRINLGIGLAALALVGCMAASTGGALTTIVAGPGDIPVAAEE
jgi:hypothetical protein